MWPWPSKLQSAHNGQYDGRLRASMESETASCQLDFAVNLHSIAKPPSMTTSTPGSLPGSAPSTRKVEGNRRWDRFWRTVLPALAAVAAPAGRQQKSRAFFDTASPRAAVPDADQMTIWAKRSRGVCHRPKLEILAQAILAQRIRQDWLFVRLRQLKFDARGRFENYDLKRRLLTRPDFPLTCNLPKGRPPPD